jgi:hypothetical protein
LDGPEICDLIESRRLIALSVLRKTLLSSLLSSLSLWLVLGDGGGGGGGGRWSIWSRGGEVEVSRMSWWSCCQLDHT